jgi:hypothetical protein
LSAQGNGIQSIVLSITVPHGRINPSGRYFRSIQHKRAAEHAPPPEFILEYIVIFVTMIGREMLHRTRVVRAKGERRREACLALTFLLLFFPGNPRAGWIISAACHKFAIRCVDPDVILTIYFLTCPPALVSSAAHSTRLISDI